MKSEGEQYFGYGVIDSCINIKSRSGNGERYLFGFRLREDGNTSELLPIEEIGCYYKQLEICGDDVFSKPTVKEYMIFSAALKKHGFVFNRKKDKLVKK